MIINEVRMRIIKQRTLIRGEIDRLQNYLEYLQELSELNAALGDDTNSFSQNLSASINDINDEIEACIKRLEQAEEALYRVDLNLWT